MLKEQLIKSLEELTLEIASNHVDFDRDFDFYFVDIVNSHKKLLEGNLNSEFEKFIPFNFNSLLANRHDLSSLSESDKAKVNRFNKARNYLSDLLTNKYVTVPDHIVVKENEIKINWSKFKLEDHIKMIKESMTMLGTLSLDYKMLNGFKDMSGFLVESPKGYKQSSNNLLTEGSALGCPKQELAYAENTFSKVVPIVEKALTKGGFYVEGIYNAGSLRRKKSVVGDLDFVVNIAGHKDYGTIKNEGAFAEKQFEDEYKFLFGRALKTNLKDDIQSEIYMRKSIVQFRENNMQCDIFMCTPSSIHNRRCYWTGSAPFNAKLMYEGFKKNKLYAHNYIFDKNMSKFLIPRNEKDIFDIFGVDYVKPEHRY